MTDAAVGTAAPAAAAAAFHCSQLPTGQTLHSLYLRGLTDAQVQTIKNQASAGQMDFAILNADRVRNEGHEGIARHARQTSVTRTAAQCSPWSAPKMIHRTSGCIALGAVAGKRTHELMLLHRALVRRVSNCSVCPSRRDLRR